MRPSSRLEGSSLKTLVEPAVNEASRSICIRSRACISAVARCLPSQTGEVTTPRPHRPSDSTRRSKLNHLIASQLPPPSPWLHPLEPLPLFALPSRPALKQSVYRNPTARSPPPQLDRSHQPTTASSVRHRPLSARAGVPLAGGGEAATGGGPASGKRWRRSSRSRWRWRRSTAPAVASPRGRGRGGGPRRPSSSSPCSPRCCSSAPRPSSSCSSTSPSRPRSSPRTSAPAATLHTRPSSRPCWTMRGRLSSGPPSSTCPPSPPRAPCSSSAPTRCAAEAARTCGLWWRAWRRRCRTCWPRPRPCASRCRGRGPSPCCCCPSRSPPRTSPWRTGPAAASDAACSSTGSTSRPSG